MISSCLKRRRGRYRQRHGCIGAVGVGSNHLTAPVCEYRVHFGKQLLQVGFLKPKHGLLAPRCVRVGLVFDAPFDDTTHAAHHAAGSPLVRILNETVATFRISSKSSPT